MYPIWRDAVGVPETLRPFFYQLVCELRHHKPARPIDDDMKKTSRIAPTACRQLNVPVSEGCTF